MDQEAIIQYVIDAFAGVDIERPTGGPGAGDTFFYYDPRRDRDRSRTLPFATIVTKDYEGWDTASNLNRPGVFRLNIGVGRDTFRALFGQPPTADPATNSDYDFAALDRLLPHPTYAQQWWVCVLNPSPATFETVKPLLADAYQRDVTRHARRQASNG